MSDPDIERIKAVHAETIAKRNAEEAAQRERELHKKNQAAKAKEDWADVWTRVKRLVETFDAELRDSGLRFEYGIIDRAPENGRIAQAEVILHGTPKDKRLVLNVDTTGSVRPVVIIPHTGKDLGNFSLSDATDDRLRAELVNFLEQAVK